MKINTPIITHLGNKIPKPAVEQADLVLEYGSIEDACGFFRGIQVGRCKAHLTHNGYFATAEKGSGNLLVYVKKAS